MNWKDPVVGARDKSRHLLARVSAVHLNLKTIINLPSAKAVDMVAFLNACLIGCTDLVNLWNSYYKKPDVMPWTFKGNGTLEH